MPQQEGYCRWPTNQDVTLVLALVNSAGAGVTGATPEVSIRRYKETQGSLLDGQFWDSTSEWFTTTPTWYPLVEYDPVNNPGHYIYLWEQKKVGLEWIYHVYYRNTGVPNGMAVETHIITNEVYIPAVQPDPIIVGPQTVMGQLELVKGLLHHNSMVDNQTYEAGQLTSARVRMFVTPDAIPTEPGGSETLGLLAEFQIESTYNENNLNKQFVLKRVFP